jgi:hypothetical protein
MLDFRPTGVREIETDFSRQAKTKKDLYYFPFGIQVRETQIASKLGGCCAVLFFIIHFRRAVTDAEWVTLPNAFLSEFGIDKNAKQRGLALLEKAKLINVKRVLGNSARIKLVTRARRRHV